ncbi:hypothetical protein UO65_3776 [Actinokineospora spheciospongiae]|uniref:Ig-like domain-containing protein n=1 Tax=Actinokineospora spheciospongiae TaxID=909613 RepID=W7IWL6_9PSEU|nr:hypothetical protein [Actinokineospora spheciospongiae]EWC60846.1 hypothetical protein UO65_3776 [Actinokineospora spheciospongiae]
MITSFRTAAAVLPAAACTSALLVLGSSTPASAGVLDVTCAPPSSEVVNFSPPLTMTPQTVTVSTTTQYGPCVSLSNPALTSGARTNSSSAPGQTCLELLTNGPTTFTVTWNTGQTSTISANRTSTVVGAALVTTHTGTVTAGLFAGSTAVQVLTGAAADVLPCTLGLGTVASIYSAVTLEITSV